MILVVMYVLRSYLLSRSLCHANSNAVNSHVAIPRVITDNIAQDIAVEKPTDISVILVRIKTATQENIEVDGAAELRMDILAMSVRTRSAQQVDIEQALARVPRTDINVLTLMDVRVIRHVQIITILMILVWTR